MSIDDQTLMAFADGELPAARAAEVAAAVAADPALAAKVERFRAVRGKLAGSLDGLAPPPDVLARAEAATARQAVRMRPFVGAMLAAGIAGVVLGVTLPWEGRGRYNDAIGPDMRTRGSLTRALEKTPSGSERRILQAKVQPLFTARAGDGEPCRAFRVVRTSESFEGVACRERRRWRIVALAQIPPQPKGYVQASGGEAPAIAAALDALNVGDPLSKTAEQALIDRRWKLPGGWGE